MPTRRVPYGVTFAVLLAAGLSFSLLQSLIVPAIPALQRTLHTSTSSATWLLTGYLLSAAIATPVLGRKGDMIGKARMLAIVLAALSVGSLLSALTTSFPVMLAGRVIQGAGGAVFPLAFGIIRDEFPRPRVAWAIGILSAALGVGVGLGTVLAGPIIDHLDYHWLFWIPLMLSLGSMIATAYAVPRSPVTAPGRTNWTSAVLMSGWLVTGLLAVSYGPVWGWASTAVVALLAATPVIVLAWAASESRSDSPLVDMQMMRIPAVWTTNLAAMLFGFGMFAMFVILPQFVETPRDTGYGFAATVTESGLYLLPFAIAMLVIAPFTGRLALWVGSKMLLIVGSIVSAASYGLLAVAHHQAWNLYVATALLGVGVALGYAAMANLIIEAVPATQTGVATGMNTNIRNIGAAVGAGVTTSLVISRVSWRGLLSESGYVLAFTVCAATFVVAALAAALIPKRVGAARLPVSHPALTAEAAVEVGAIAYTPGYS